MAGFALRQFQKLELDVRREAAEIIEELREDPFPFDSGPMGGYSDLYRVKFYGGKYRMVYLVYEQSRKVVIMRIGPRGSVYARLRRPSR